MKDELSAYHQKHQGQDRLIMDRLYQIIDESLVGATAKIWHAHPVWFVDDNPTVGYSLFKSGVRLMFWSGADFDEPGLTPGSGKFKDASKTYTDVSEVEAGDVERWLEKSRNVVWDYKNLVKRKGQLLRLK